MIVKTIRLSVGPKSTQEGVRLMLDFFRLDSLRRNYGETMRHWTRRFALQNSKVGQALTERFKFRNQQGLSARKHSMYFAA